MSSYIGAAPTLMPLSSSYRVVTPTDAIAQMQVRRGDPPTLLERTAGMIPLLLVTGGISFLLLTRGPARRRA